ncbi:conserved hypothetical protein [delta proteobacterium NaphS2]|nr:conserved hypothetical protein [delta proteobacterium NaphS2]
MKASSSKHEKNLREKWLYEFDQMPAEKKYRCKNCFWLAVDETLETSGAIGFCGHPKLFSRKPASLEVVQRREDDSCIRFSVRNPHRFWRDAQHLFEDMQRKRRI